MRYWDVFLNEKLVCTGILADDKKQALEFVEKEKEYVRTFLGYIENGESVTTSVKVSR